MTEEGALKSGFFRIYTTVVFSDALYINVILTCRQKIFAVLWLLLWLQVAEVGPS